MGEWMWIHVFLTSALVGGEYSASRPSSFTPRESVHSTQWIGGWMDPGTGLGYAEKRKFLLCIEFTKFE
jgi:hypothetical protein